MQVGSALRAAGNTHPGLLRGSNEDRFHYDPVRGLFIVIDGVGGQAAGDTAAETALRQIRSRLEAGAGSAEERVRDAITNANNEIHRLASVRPEWQGMACVLTVAVLDGGDLVVGHVGDTRMYKLRRGRIDKVTRDHSPIGEREDAGELSEADAMRHPRRNEVYRDVGSEPHQGTDASFMDVIRVPFEDDAAILLCSDGLTDQVDSITIRRTVEEHAGHPYEIVRALIEAANEGGGKDNVTVVYAEGSRFAQGADTRDLVTRRSGIVDLPTGPPPPVRRGRRWRIATLVLLLLAVIGGALYSRYGWPSSAAISLPENPAPAVVVVAPGATIADAIARAGVGTQIIVEPGEYRERVVLKSGVRLRSRVPRCASIRLPAGAAETDAAIVAADISDAEVAGFRIVGDAATPLGTGVSSTNAGLTLTDIEIQGASSAGVVFEVGAAGGLLGSDVHDNAGAGVIVRSGAAPRIAHNAFVRNATSGRAAGPMLIEAGGRPDVRGNTFLGVGPDAVIGLLGEAAASVVRDNWFVTLPRVSTPPPAARGQGRPGRQGSR